MNFNAIEFAPFAQEVADAMVKLASGEWSETHFRRWVAKHSNSRRNPPSAPIATR
jgi:prophage maintenance system killer protein